MPGRYQVMFSYLCCSINFNSLILFGRVGIYLETTDKKIMKSKIVLSVIVMAMSVSVSAQGLKFGIKGGADLHKISGQAFKSQFAFGYHLGVFAEVKLTSKFGIQPEIYFSQTDLDTSDRFSSITQFSNVTHSKLTYLNVPVLLNYKIIKPLSLQAGPQLGFLLDKTSGLRSNGNDILESGDFGMAFGFQLHIPKVRVYGRYFIGLNNIRDLGMGDSWKNQAVHIGIGYNLL